MAIHAPIMGAPNCATLLDRIEHLQSTAEYITTLLEIVTEDVRKLQGFCREPSPPMTVADLGDWNRIQTILCLASEQVETVASASRDLEAARMAARFGGPG